MVKTIKFLVFGVLLLVGCDDQPVVIEDSSAYFPLQVGMYQIYQVDEILYSELAAPQTNAYQLKIDVVDSFKTIDGAYQYVLYRSIRSNENEPWQYEDTWSGKLSDVRAVIQEGNTSFVKLAFPLNENREWDGNAFNDLGEDIYQLMNVKQPYTIEGLPEFENTITVNQSDNQDFIVYQDKRSEVYAWDVGLIEKQVLQLYYYTLPVEDIGKQKIKSGIDFSQRLTAYGFN